MQSKRVLIFLFVAFVALCSVAMTLALLRWPVATGLVLAAGVSVLMLATIYQIVSADRLAERIEPPNKHVAATVDGRPVRDVKVMQP